MKCNDCQGGHTHECTSNYQKERSLAWHGTYRVPGPREIGQSADWELMTSDTPASSKNMKRNTSLLGWQGRGMAWNKGLDSPPCSKQ
jgi:hypothetical protein